MAQFKIPKIVGELKIIENKAGTLSVWNGLKKGENKIMIPCRDEQHGQAIIDKIKSSTQNDLISYWIIPHLMKLYAHNKSLESVIALVTKIDIRDPLQFIYFGDNRNSAQLNRYTSILRINN